MRPHEGRTVIEDAALSPAVVRALCHLLQFYIVNPWDFKTFLVKSDRSNPKYRVPTQANCVQNALANGLERVERDF